MLVPMCSPGNKNRGRLLRGELAWAHQSCLSGGERRIRCTLLSDGHPEIIRNLDHEYIAKEDGSQLVPGSDQRLRLGVCRQDQHVEGTPPGPLRRRPAPSSFSSWTVPRPASSPVPGTQTISPVMVWGRCRAPCPRERLKYILNLNYATPP